MKRRGNELHGIAGKSNAEAVSRNAKSSTGDETTGIAEAKQWLQGNAMEEHWTVKR